MPRPSAGRELRGGRAPCIWGAGRYSGVGAVGSPSSSVGVLSGGSGRSWGGPWPRATRDGHVRLFLWLHVASGLCTARATRQDDIFSPGLLASSASTQSTRPCLPVTPGLAARFLVLAVHDLVDLSPFLLGRSPGARPAAPAPTLRPSRRALCTHLPGGGSQCGSPGAVWGGGDPFSLCSRLGVVGGWAGWWGSILEGHLLRLRCPSTPTLAHLCARSPGRRASRRAGGPHSPALSEGGVYGALGRATSLCFF